MVGVLGPPEDNQRGITVRALDIGVAYLVEASGFAKIAPGLFVRLIYAALPAGVTSIPDSAIDANIDPHLPSAIKPTQFGLSRSIIFTNSPHQHELRFAVRHCAVTS